MGRLLRSGPGHSPGNYRSNRTETTKGRKKWFMRGSTNIRDVSNLQCSGGLAIDRALGCNVGSAVGAPAVTLPLMRPCLLAVPPSHAPSSFETVSLNISLPPSFFPSVLGQGTPVSAMRPGFFSSPGAPLLYALSFGSLASPLSCKTPVTASCFMSILS